ncbi:unnamed protein product [Menidia menidia]|uniref:(Atlantic silverside) hypothetical protein n=1 Tax=Menidia menidia TaxID=238744 RepID=A0A8S4ALP1_9TELE|nr:unnamed protein product [Menidia menidia]
MALVLFSPRFIHTLNAVLLVWMGLSWSSPIQPPQSHHRTSLGVDQGDNPLLNAQEFVSQFLSTLNLTRLMPQTRPLAAHNGPLPEYMLELYNRFANDRSTVPSANIVRSFKNEDSSSYIIRENGVRIHPLLFNISMPHNENIILAELRLFTLVRKAQRSHPGFDCKVTIYKVHEGVVWTKEVGKEGRGRDKEEVLEMKDLEKLVTKDIHAKDKSWVSFDLTHMVKTWRKSGRGTHRLEVHIANLGSEEADATHETTDEGQSLVEIDIDKGLEGNHNSALIVFSDDQSENHKQDEQEPNQMVKHENIHPENLGRSEQPLWGDGNHNSGYSSHDEPGEQSAEQLQSNLIYDTPPRIRRNVKSEPCKRTPLFVDFKDIGWDSWIIQPLGYEAYKCNGVCNPPLTSEVSPTRHAIVQSRLSIKSPERASRACCVPTKLEPISLLYHDNGVITFNHKYEGMVVAECGCR